MAKAMSGQNIVKPSLDDLAMSVKTSENSSNLPPVHDWNPPFCGDLDMRIARNGTWFYQGSPINRFALVKLFSSILKKEDGQHFLVTPVEKFRITVEDAPFVAVDFHVTGSGSAQSLTFETHVGDIVTAGPDSPMHISHHADSGEPSPYIIIRDGLDALIDRKTFYRLIDLGVHQKVNGESWFGVFSGGTFFPFTLSAELQ